MQTLSIKAIESKTAKHLRKANRLKNLHAKLGQVDEAIAIIQAQLPPASVTVENLTEVQKQEYRYLEHLLELCHIHTLKFQIDAVLSDVRTRLQDIAQTSESLSQKLFNELRQQLQAILDIDAGYLEVGELLHLLNMNTPESIKETEDNLAASLSQYKKANLRIELTCRLEDVEAHDTLKARAPHYRFPGNSTSSVPLCHLRFSLKNLKDLELFHEELRVKPSYAVMVNGQEMEEQHFSDWFQCYKRFRNAKNPRYCYGASPFTYNFFGCHKLYIPDIAKQLDQCWFYHGTLHQESGIFFLSTTIITEHIRQHLAHCGFCPALTSEKLDIGMRTLPHYINPICDPQWRYYYTHGERTGVIPAGDEIVIASVNPDFAHPESLTLVEVSPTPYIWHVFNYLETHNPVVLFRRPYSGLSRCIRCGSSYKPHTMICSKCKVDFWKYALKNLEQALAQLYATPDMKSQLSEKKEDLPRHVLPKQGEIPRIAASRTATSHESVSFDQLWNDPEVQQILSDDNVVPPEGEPPASLPQKEEELPPSQRKSSHPPQDIHKALAELSASRRARARKRPQRPSSSERLQFHEKIWGLISQKYRERKAIETAFSDSPSLPQKPSPALEQPASQETQSADISTGQTAGEQSFAEETTLPPSSGISPQETSASVADTERAALLNAIKSLKPRQTSELSKRGVVRVIYHATMDKDTCPLCQYLDGMVMDPDDPATDIFSPPLYPGCTCSREYVLTTEKPQNWPKVTFKFPPKDLLGYLDKNDT